MNYKLIIGDVISWFAGLIFLAIGLINSFWGNDPYFGLLIVLISFMYLPPVDDLVRKLFNFNVPLFLKVLMAILIVMASLGVGELFAKMELMMADL